MTSPSWAARTGPPKIRASTRSRKLRWSGTFSPRTTCRHTTARSHFASGSTVHGVNGSVSGRPKRGATASRSATISLSRVALIRRHWSAFACSTPPPVTTRATRPAGSAGLCAVPGVGDAGQPSQYRSGLAVSSRRTAPHPGRNRREPAHGVHERTGPPSTIARNATVQLIVREVINFSDARGRSAGLRRERAHDGVAGIYDLRSHLDDVLRPVLRFWNVFELEDLQR